MPVFHTRDTNALLPLLRSANTTQREMIDLRDDTGAGNFITGATGGVITFTVDVNGALVISSIQITGLTAGMLAADSSGNVTSLTPNAYQAHPADPTGATGAIPVMMGIAGAITPVATAVKVTLSGILTSGAAVAHVQLMYGIGAVPANGAPAAGSSPIDDLTGVANTSVPFSTQFALASVTPGVALWFDAKLTGGAASTATITKLSITIEEIR